MRLSLAPSRWHGAGAVQNPSEFRDLSRIRANSGRLRRILDHALDQPPFEPGTQTHFGPPDRRPGPACPGPGYWGRKLCIGVGDFPTPIRWLPTPIGGCAPAKSAKNLVVAYSYRWLPAPMRSGACAESATEPCAWSATEPRGWERRFHSWVKHLAGGAVQNAPGCRPAVGRAYLLRPVLRFPGAGRAVSTQWSNLTHRLRGRGNRAERRRSGPAPVRRARTAARRGAAAPNVVRVSRLERPDDEPPTPLRDLHPGTQHGRGPRPLARHGHGGR